MKQYVCSSSHQLTQWRQFEEDINPHPSHMAKYFSSKSLRSSENDIYYLLGEYDSMKRLISEVRTGLTLPTYRINVAQPYMLKMPSDYTWV